MLYQLELLIEKATVIQNEHSTDYVILHVMLPSPTPKITNERLRLTFNAEQGKGSTYVKRHFGISAEVIQS